MKEKVQKICGKVLVIVILLILSNSIIYLVLSQPVFRLKGSNLVKVSLMDDYSDLGVIASSCGWNDCNDLSNKVTIESDVDSTKVGIYNVTYSLKYNNKEYNKKRQVRVIDTEKPEIKLIGPDVVSVCPNKEYEEEGYEASDNYDGVITEKVIVNSKNNTIKYEVVDSSNNYNKIKRTIVKEDKEAPVIELKGKNVVTLIENSKYVEDGYIVTDNCDGDISNKVTVNSNVNVAKAGTYNVEYHISDENGNESSASRTVIVKEKVDYNNGTSNSGFLTTSKNEYIKSLENYIKQKNYNVSIGYVNMQTGYTYKYRPNTIYYGASLVKTVGALYAYENMNVDSEIKPLVEKAISVSDNDAHRKLTNKIGINNLRTYGRSLGAKNFLTRSDNDYYGMTTVEDQIAIWKYLYSFINTNNKGRELQSYFINSYYNFLLFDNSPVIMHKYGYYGDYYHDVGIVYSDKPYMVVILTKHGNRNFQGVVKDLSEKIYGLNKIDG